MTLILTGFKNCGKSSIGQALAAAHGYRVVDTDDMIVAAHGDGTTARDVFQALGAHGFRSLEEDVVGQIEAADDLVVATGGGVMMSPKNTRHLKSIGRVCYIKVDSETLYERMMASDQLPAFIDANDTEKSFGAYYQDRAPRYEAVADYIIDGAGKTPADIADEIIKTMEPSHGQ